MERAYGLAGESMSFKPSKMDGGNSFKDESREGSLETFMTAKSNG
jgi:hypothetical protein